jgi:hypothetical protein
MSLEIRESLPLARFIYDRAWVPVRGTYLSPLRFFASDRTLDPNDYLEVIRVVDVAGTNFAITRGGGLFVREDERYSNRDGLEALVHLYNLLQAEFAFHGIPAHPVTDIEIQSGKLIGKHASITGGFGAFAERTWGPYVLLSMHKRDLGTYYGQAQNDYWPQNFYWMPCDPSLPERVHGVPNALRLRDISSTLPTLLVAACYHATRHDLAEGMVTSWIVVEEILSYLWDDHLSRIAERERRDRLADNRTYSAAVRIEVLQVAGTLPTDLCRVLHEARKLRNALAHRAVMGLQAADVCLQAMRQMLSYVGLPATQLPGVTYQSGGIGPPSVALEPDFPF